MQHQFPYNVGGEAPFVLCSPRQETSQ